MGEGQLNAYRLQQGCGAVREDGKGDRGLGWSFAIRDKMPDGFGDFGRALSAQLYSKNGTKESVLMKKTRKRFRRWS